MPFHQRGGGGILGSKISAHPRGDPASDALLCVEVSELLPAAPASDCVAADLESLYERPRQDNEAGEVHQSGVSWQGLEYLRFGDGGVLGKRFKVFRELVFREHIGRCACITAWQLPCYQAGKVCQEAPFTPSRVPADSLCYSRAACTCSASAPSGLALGQEKPWGLSMPRNLVLNPDHIHY